MKRPHTLDHYKPAVLATPPDTVLDIALATPPPISIPADFATRVAHLASAQAAAPATTHRPMPPHGATRSYAFRFGVLAVLLLTVALFALAHGASPALGNLRFDLQMTLLLELLLLAVFTPRVLSQRL